MIETIYTPRLEMRVLDGSAAGDVLDFYMENPEFEHYEAERSFEFYTYDHMKRTLEYEYQVISKMMGLRLWVFEANAPYKIIGTVSFQNMIYNVYKSCQIGYKFHKNYQNKGYAREAVTNACKEGFDVFDIHRIEAYTMPDNLPSKRLLEKVGFTFEGLSRDRAMIRGQWEDHMLYSLLKTDKF